MHQFRVNVVIISMHNSTRVYDGINNTYQVPVIYLFAMNTKARTTVVGREISMECTSTQTKCVPFSYDNWIRTPDPSICFSLF